MPAEAVAPTRAYLMTLRVSSPSRGCDPRAGARDARRTRRAGRRGGHDRLARFRRPTTRSCGTSTTFPSFGSSSGPGPAPTPPASWWCSTSARSPAEKPHLGRISPDLPIAAGPVREKDLIGPLRSIHTLLVPMSAEQRAMDRHRAVAPNPSTDPRGRGPRRACARISRRSGRSARRTGRAQASTRCSLSPAPPCSAWRWKRTPGSEPTRRPHVARSCPSSPASTSRLRGVCSSATRRGGSRSSAATRRRRSRRSFASS